MSYRREITNKVKEELAKQWNCDVSVIDSNKNVFIVDKKQFFQMCTFGNKILIRAEKEICHWAKEKFSEIDAKYIMNTDNLYLIESKMREYSKRLAGEHVRFLFEEKVQMDAPQTEVRFQLFEFGDMPVLHQYKGFNNALNYKNDVIAIGAFDGDKLIALAGADDTMEPMWQIGIDTLPEYRQMGIAVYLVNRLAWEIVNREKIPFYTTWSPNIASCRVALNSGFFPAWLEYFAEDIK